MIETLALTKIYQDKQRGEIRAADGVSFNCRQGEIFGLLGPNGAGKTTTLRMLSTVIKPTSGTARINGHDIVKSPAHVRASIGFVSGTTGLFPRMTPAEILLYFGRLHHVPEDRLRERISELTRVFAMDAFMDVRCERLSTGMRQKVSIARTLIHDPPVLIFDEPTVGLDILVASTMMQFIQGCREENRAVIFSTHTMSEAEKLCDRIAIIHNGKILAIGSLDALRVLTGKRFLEDVFISLVRERETP
ncbi:ATP-binding cassette domain-containing protein [bacterium]|nr:ATP-binding cassette domain-containing protein [candidate division CSSED10-310 bacterium]